MLTKLLFYMGFLNYLLIDLKIYDLKNSVQWIQIAFFVGKSDLKNAAIQKWNTTVLLLKQFKVSFSLSKEL